MGVVGAAASLGFDGLHEDHTFELVAYRKPEMCGRPRSVGVESVKKMRERDLPAYVQQYDHESGRVLLAPHGPDPGFRGIAATRRAWSSGRSRCWSMRKVWRVT